MEKVMAAERAGADVRADRGTWITRRQPRMLTLAVYACQRFFQEVRYGYGSAINMLLLALAIAIGGVFAWRLYHAGR